MRVRPGKYHTERYPLSFCIYKEQRREHAKPSMMFFFKKDVNVVKDDGPYDREKRKKQGREVSAYNTTYIRRVQYTRNNFTP